MIRNNLKGQAKKHAARETIELRALARMIGKNDRTRRKTSSRRAALAFLQRYSTVETVLRKLGY